MSVSRLPSGRWRAQVYDPKTRKNRSVAQVLDQPSGTTWATKREAKTAREDARKLLHATARSGVTVGEFWDRWTTDPLFKRPKESTNIHNKERTKAFASLYRDRPIRTVGDVEVADWIKGGRNVSTVMALRAMFNDAASAKVGRLTTRNPFANLGLGRSKGRRELQPPTVEQAWKLIEAAHKVACPSFAGWLQAAMFTGMRPGELDALRWDCVDFEKGWIDVREQWNAKTRSFTSPKNGKGRLVPLHKEVRAALFAADDSKEFCFVSLSGAHWTPSARAYHWKAVRAKVGWEHDLYLATRHFAGWYMYEHLRLDAEDVAFALGHEDMGDLVRRVYGHRDREAGLERVRRAFEGRDNVRELRAVDDVA